MKTSARLRRLTTQLCGHWSFSVYRQTSSSLVELFSVQANFIKSGVLLVICIYHSICDGVGQYYVTEMLANQCRAIGQRKAMSNGTSAPASNLKLSFSPDQFDRSHLFDGAPKADVDAPLLLYCSPRTHEGPASLGHTRWHTPRKRNLPAPQICTRRAQSPGHQPETLLNIRT